MFYLGCKTLGHDTAAAIVDSNGKVLAAAAQERFDRTKHSKDFPAEAIDFCCQMAGIKIQELLYLAISYDFQQAFERLILRTTIDYFPSSIKSFFTMSKYHIDKKIQTWAMFRKIGFRGKIVYLDHHDCHAASAYYMSPFDRALVITIDGRGEWVTARAYVGSGTELKRLCDIAYYPHSLGLFYTAITEYLGFTPNAGEGTLMALASLGDPNIYYEEFKKFFKVYDGRFTIDTEYFKYHLDRNRRLSEKFIKKFGRARRQEDSLEVRHKNIAAAAQKILEEIEFNIIEYYARITKQDNLCLAGGVALNSVANGIIYQSGLFKDIYIQPAATDDGSALGAALLSFYQEEQPNKKIIIKEDIYLGTEYSESRIRKALKRFSLQYRYINRIEFDVAKILAQGKIVGWFQGRAEFGPRALGNRSILADPRTATMKDIINNNVKFRESFRPLAPSILEEETKDYFHFNGRSPHMLYVAKVKASKKSKISAVLHVDDTARLHTVSRKANKKFWKLIKAFDHLTGIPLLLNTSFNGKGEPIVNTPEDAVKCFLRTNIDCLAIGNYLVFKS